MSTTVNGTVVTAPTLLKLIEKIQEICNAND